MYELSDFNLFGLKSNLINNLDYNENINETKILLNISEKALYNFNSRRVTFDTINEIYNILEYLMIDDSFKFLIDFSIPSLEIFKLDKIKLPIFMLAGEKLKIFNTDIIKSIINFNAIHWLKFLYLFDSYNIDPITCYKLGYVEVIYKAINNNNNEILFYLLNRNFGRYDLYYWNIYEDAIKMNNVDLLEYLYNTFPYKFKLKKNLFYWATLKNSNLNILNCLLNKDCKLDSPTYYQHCLINNNIKNLKFLKENNCPLPNNIIVNNVDNINIECIDYLISIGIKVKKN